MSDWPGQKSRGRGQLLSGSSRSGRGFYAGGRRVLLMDEPGTELVWAGDSIVQFTEDVLEATFSTLAERGERYMERLTPVDEGDLVASIYAEIEARNGRFDLIIGAEDEAAIFQELGTSRHRAQPFMRPTLDYLAAEVPRVLRAEAAARGGG